MKILIALFCFVSLSACGQSLKRQFFTTNTDPIVEVVAGSNATVQASTPAVQTRRFTVNAIPTPGGITNNQAGPITLGGVTMNTNTLHAQDANLGDLIVTNSGYFYTHTNAPGVTIIGTGGSTVNQKPLLLLWNTNGAGAYTNEVGIRLRSGTASGGNTTTGRGYIGWQTYAGNDRWTFGDNGDDCIILFNAGSIHRMWISGSTYPSGAYGGISAFNSLGAMDARINWYPSSSTATNSTGVGGGGFSVWAPGASNAFFVARTNSGGCVAIGTTNVSAARLTVEGNIVVSTTITATNGFMIPQLAVIPTNSIPITSTTASVTNWFFVNIGGIPQMLATNYAAGGWLQKALWP